MARHCTPRHPSYCARILFDSPAGSHSSEGPPLTEDEAHRVSARAVELDARAAAVARVTVDSSTIFVRYRSHLRSLAGFEQLPNRLSIVWLYDSEPRKGSHGMLTRYMRRCLLKRMNVGKEIAESAARSSSFPLRANVRWSSRAVFGSSLRSLYFIRHPSLPARRSDDA